MSGGHPSTALTNCRGSFESGAHERQRLTEPVTAINSRLCLGAHGNVD